MYTNQAPLHAPIGRAASPNPGSRSPALGLINRSPLIQERPLYGYPNQTMSRPLSRGPSPAPPAAYGATSPQVSGFQVEKRARSPNPFGRPMPQPDLGAREELLYQDHVSALIAAKNDQFAVSGRIPVDPAQFVLFFRSKTGVAHSLDFPIDVSYNTPPALDVLIAACRPHAAPDYTGSFGGQQALFYPTNLPLTASLEIANFPILDAIRDSLFPNLPIGKHLTAVLDKLEVVETGSRLAAHSPAHLRNDDRAATIIVSLPVRHRGGAIIVRNVERREERFLAIGGKSGDLDWIALRSDCTYEIEPVQNGVSLAITYAVFVQSFGPATNNPDTLITPTDQFFNLLSPILNLSRGKTIAFYLNQDYISNPAETVANSLVPQLKGGDSLLYDAFKFHKLAPDLHWTAGGFVWPVDQTLEFFVDDVHGPVTANPTNLHKMRSPSPNPGFGRMPQTRGTGYGANPLAGGGGGSGMGPGGYEDDGGVGSRVRGSGALSFAEANITLLTDHNNPNPAIGKERVEFVSNGELTKLVVNVLLVVFIP